MPAHRKRAQEEAAIRLLKKGHTTAIVAAHEDVGVHPSTVKRWAKKHGIKLTFPYNRHEHRSDLVDIDKIIRLKKQTDKGRAQFTYEEIAGLCGCSRSYVSRVLTNARRKGLL